MNKAIDALKATCSSTQQDAFNYFKQLLAEEHVPKWREIIEDQCNTTLYIDLTGQKVTNKPRGCGFDALVFERELSKSAFMI